MTRPATAAIQEVPWETINLLSPFFGRTNYLPIDLFLSLPMLRGLWVASVNSSGNWCDLSGLGKTLTYNGNPTFNYAGLVPYWDLDGVGDYFSRADEADLDILGTEAYVAAAIRGLTVGGWFWWDVIDIAWGDGLVFKSDLANQRAYEFGNAATPIFRVSQNGVASTQIVSSVALTTGRWYYVVARFFPNVGLYVTVNETTDSNLVAPLASIFNSNRLVEVGIAASIAATALDGRIACLFLCAAALSDTWVDVLYQSSKRAFGHV